MSEQNDFEPVYTPIFNADGNHPPIEIPKESLSADALAGIVDSFVMREGTDYGSNEVSYESKLAQVQRQIASGGIKIVFDPNTESVTLMTQHDWKKLTL